MKISAIICLMAGLAPWVYTAAQEAVPGRRPPTPDDKGQPQRAMLVKYALLMPNDKTFEHVKTDERNPFGKSEEEEKKLAIKGSNEENIIRDQLTKLRVSGVRLDESGGVEKVMLGNMILAKDQVLPQVVPSQTLSLKVGALTPSYIELIWVEKKHTSLPPRILTLPVDFRPVVHYVLQGQVDKKSMPSKRTDPKSAMGQQFDRDSLAPASPLQIAKKNPLGENGEEVTPPPPPPPPTASTPEPSPSTQPAVYRPDPNQPQPTFQNSDNLPVIKPKRD